VVAAGSDAVLGHIEELNAGGVRHVVVDATSDDDLHTVAQAAQGLRLLTGGAGLAGALGTVLGRGVTTPTARLPLPEGPAVVLAGSCSAATLDQVEKAGAEMASYRLDPTSTPDPQVMVDRALGWLRSHVHEAPVLMYSSADSEMRARAQAAMGPDTAGHLERALGQLADEAVSLGARRVVVAGGETSGAVVQALGLSTVVVQDEADRGVPWVLTTGDEPIALLLKSGNFGRPDLLVRAATQAAS
jgi:uncharacterized protein YgbK (DUF1537 family)